MAVPRANIEVSVSNGRGDAFALLFAIVGCALFELSFLEVVVGLNESRELVDGVGNDVLHVGFVGVTEGLVEVNVAGLVREIVVKSGARREAGAGGVLALATRLGAGVPLGGGIAIDG